MQQICYIGRFWKNNSILKKNLIWVRICKIFPIQSHSTAKLLQFGDEKHFQCQNLCILPGQLASKLKKMIALSGWFSCYILIMAENKKNK